MAPRMRFTDPMKPELIAGLRMQLGDGELLMWATSPVPPLEHDPLRPGKIDAAAILGGGYLTVGACVLAVRSGQWLWMLVPLTLLALGLLWFYVTRRRKARRKQFEAWTAYALTTRRALLMYAYPELDLRALELSTITDVSVSNIRDDYGDLTFQTASSPAALVFPRVSEPETAREHFMRAISDPAQAEEQTRAAEAYAMQMQELVRRSRGG